MNKTDYLLTCLMEECNEISKECARALRFGLTDKWVQDPLPPDWKDLPLPKDAIVHEFYDAMAVLHELYENGDLEQPSDLHIGYLIREKKKRIEKYMKYSAERGRYSDDSIKSILEMINKDES